MPSANNPVSAPVRLAPIIRAPDRETKNAQRSARQQQQKTETTPVFTIYVNSAACRHSMDLLKEITETYRVPCSVIDVAADPNIPSWLKGTPSVVVGTDVYCGDTAFQFVATVSANRQKDENAFDPSLGQTSSFTDIFSGKSAKKKNDGIGCGLSQAFSPPVCISEEEATKKYSGSVDDAMARLMQSRGNI